MPIKLGCVPEHFSAPLMYAAEQGELEGVELTMCKRLSCGSVVGTGDMVKRVLSGELDAAICVTEGLVAGIDKYRDNGLRMCGTFVKSPLRKYQSPWAVSIKGDSPYCSLDDLAFGATFGISREGSGSEVMAKYASNIYEWKTPKFAVLGDVGNLVQGVVDGKADAFLWERTTMQRHYSTGAVRYLGTVKPPWPAFAIAAMQPFVDSGRMTELAEKLRRAVHVFMEELPTDQRIAFICDRLGYSNDDVCLWLDDVVFADPAMVDRVAVAKVVAALQKASVVGSIDVDSVVAMRE